MLIRRGAVVAVALSLLLLAALPARGPGQPARPPKPVKPQVERHPHIHKALQELRAARATLQKAAHDYGGHRVTAIGDIDQAITQLDLALQADPGARRKHIPTPPAAKALPGGSGSAEKHPHIHKALRELHAARRNLHEAAHDYQGHRVAAIKDIDHAINQLHDALRFDRR
jgi:hypothetical protein